MKSLLTILILCFTAAVQAAETNADEVDSNYFHPAASMYIHGELPAASNLVVNGLSVFPDNGKLLRLKELIEQEQEKQDQQQQNKDQNQDQQDQNEDQQQDQNQDQDQQPPEEQNEDQQPPEEQNEDQQDEQEQDPPPEEQNQQEQQAQEQEQPRAEEMSEDEAKRLLDGMKQDEKNKRLQLHPVMGAPVKVDKDW